LHFAAWRASWAVLARIPDVSRNGTDHQNLRSLQEECFVIWLHSQSSSWAFWALISAVSSIAYSPMMIMITGNPFIGYKNMARPKIDPKYRRDKIVAIRLTDYGYDRVKLLADRRGMSVAEYVRLVLKMLADGSLLMR
jgi:hypothetical protein